MVHSSRKTYKSKLESIETTVTGHSLEGHKTADALYELIEHESIAKTQLMGDIGDLGEMAVDVVRKLDEHRTKGRMVFAKSEELNDDHIKKFSAFDIIDRVFDILMTCEERIEKYAERFDEYNAAEEGIQKKLRVLEGYTAKATQMQHELYNIGPNASEHEIEAFRSAEEKGSKYKRQLVEDGSTNTLQVIEEVIAESAMIIEDTGSEQTVVKDEPKKEVERRQPAKAQSGPKRTVKA